MLNHPLSPVAARREINVCLTAGRVEITPYARGRMGERKVTEPQIYAVLRSGAVEPAELDLHSQAWRYRVRLGAIYVVVEFKAEAHGIVVTVWRRVI